MQINPYILFNGNCREAFEFYAEVLNGRIEMMVPHGETPAASSVDESWQDKIMHARLAVGEELLMASDSPPQYVEGKAAGYYVQLEFPTIEEARCVFDALAEGGEVRMGFEQTFWSRGFGMLVDRFGIPWMINCT